MSISVIVTCFNEEDFIEQALLSILNQTRLDLLEKIFIVDDGSTDNSLTILYELSKFDRRIELIQQKNAGLAVARNKALERVSSEWVCFLDGDDIWPASKIEKQVEVAEKDSSVSLIYTDSYRFGMEERYIRVRTLPQSGEHALIDYFVNDAPILSSLMIRMKVFEESGYFDPELRVAQDTEMWTRAVAGYKTKHIPEALLFRRIHPASLGADFDKKSKYLDRVTDKIINQYPLLKPYRHIKDASIRFEHARRCIRNQKSIPALKHTISGLKLNSKSVHGYVVLLMAIFPFSNKLLKLASRMRMRFMGVGKNVKIPIPVYEKITTLNKLEGKAP